MFWPGTTSTGFFNLFLKIIRQFMITMNVWKNVTIMKWQKVQLHCALALLRHSAFATHIHHCTDLQPWLFFFPLEDSENRAKDDLWIDASFCQGVTFTVSMPQTLQADESVQRADIKRLNKCSPLPTCWQTHYVARWPALKLFESPNICHSVRGLSDFAPFFCPQNDSIQVHLHTQPGSPSNHCDCLFFFSFSLRILAALISPLQLCKLHFLFMSLCALCKWQQ